MIDEKLIKLAVDGYFGRVAEHSVADSQEVLRQALIEANGGKTTLDPRDIRDGKCSKVFAIVETLVEKISEEGLKGDEMFVNFIEDRNLALGDSEKFHTEKDCLLAVADIADGHQAIRRQRVESGKDVTFDTKPRAIKVFEELSRVLAGRVDFNALVDACGRSFTQQELDEAYAIWAGMLNTLTAPYVESGVYNEEKLLDIVEHVEAATGESAVIVGTRKALRKVTTAVVSEQAKNDYYTMGYYGKLAGIDMIAMKQRHKIGTNTFILPDNVVYVIAGNGKPIKRINEGQVMMLTGNPMDNADLTQEFMMIKKSGMGVIMDREYGAYTFSGQ